MLSSVRVKREEKDEEINVNCGVPQGYSTSCLLFNVYINDLVINLNKILGVTVLAFADDIIIIADTILRLEEATKTIILLVHPR